MLVDLVIPIVVAGQEPLTPAGLANATPQEQKQMLGERLFPLIQQHATRFSWQNHWYASRNRQYRTSSYA